MILLKYSLIVGSESSNTSEEITEVEALAKLVEALGTNGFITRYSHNFRKQSFTISVEEHAEGIKEKMTFEGNDMEMLALRIVCVLHSQLVPQRYEELVALGKTWEVMIPIADDGRFMNAILGDAELRIYEGDFPLAIRLWGNLLQFERRDLKLLRYFDSGARAALYTGNRQFQGIRERIAAHLTHA